MQKLHRKRWLATPYLQHAYGFPEGMKRAQQAGLDFRKRKGPCEPD